MKCLEEQCGGRECRSEAQLLGIDRPAMFLEHLASRGDRAACTDHVPTQQVNRDVLHPLRVLLYAIIRMPEYHGDDTGYHGH